MKSCRAILVALVSFGTAMYGAYGTTTTKIAPLFQSTQEQDKKGFEHDSKVFWDTVHLYSDAHNKSKKQLPETRKIR